MAWESVRVLVTVKAYPQISDVGESVCVAGVNLDTGTWIRLYPLPFRDLPRPQQFSKYATIELDVQKRRQDTRPESFVPNIDTLSVASRPLPGGTWKRRQDLVLPLVRESMCEIRRLQHEDGVSLGMFKPVNVPDLVIEERDSRDWSPDKQLVIDQGQLLVPHKAPLEKIPYRFSYRYRCGDAACRGHNQTNVDWEISQAFRNFRADYGEQEALGLIRRKWVDELWDPKRDSYLFTGNQLAYRDQFLVLGVFWPPKQKAARGG